MSNKFFKHFKGGVYKIISDSAKDSNSLNRIVVYQNISSGEIWTRDYKDFFEQVEKDGKIINRFTETEAENYSDFDAFIDSIFDDCKKTLKNKANDYSKDTDRYSCFRSASSLAEMDVKRGIMYMIGLKIERLKNLTFNQKEIKNESIRDNLIDLINYQLLYCFFFNNSSQ